MQELKTRNYDAETMVPLLHSVAIELTNHCNLKCPVCWSQNPQLHPPRPQGFMRPELYKSVIDQLTDYYQETHTRIDLCLNYGGESLLHPSFDELLTYAKQKRAFRIRLITNGLLLHRHINLILRYGILMNFSYHQVPEDLEKIRDQNIRSMIARRRKRFNVAVVDGEAPGLYEEAKEKFGHMVYSYPLITEDLKYADGKRKGDPFCKSPFHYMAILWNGDTWPCCHLLSSDFPSLGNVNDRGVIEIWEGEEYNHLRRSPEDYPCRNCELW